MAFDKRVCYHSSVEETVCAPGCAFPSVYFCRDFLPESLMLEKLAKYERPLKEEHSTVDLEQVVKGAGMIIGKG